MARTKFPLPDPEDHYMNMDMKFGTRTMDRNLHRYNDPLNPDSYPKNRSLSPPPVLVSSQTPLTDSMRRHQFQRPDSPFGDGYIKMNQGVQITTYEQQSRSTRYLPNKGYINGPTQHHEHVMSVHSSGKLTRKKSQSLENLLSPPPPSHPSYDHRSSPDFLSPSLSSEVSSRSNSPPPSRYTHSRQHPQNLDMVYSTPPVEYTRAQARYIDKETSTAIKLDRNRYTTMPRFSTNYEDGRDSHKSVLKKKKTPPPVPIRQDVRPDSDYIRDLRTNRDTRIRSTDDRKRAPLSTHYPTDCDRTEDYTTQSGYSLVKEDEDEYDRLQKRDEVCNTAEFGMQDPDNQFPPPPSQEYLSEVS